MKAEREFLIHRIYGAESATQILDWLSEFLPARGWLTELKLDRGGEGCKLTFRGIVLPSRTSTGIEQIELYLQKLKAKLPPQATITLTTANDATEQSNGTGFTAELVWGGATKP